MNCKDFQKQFEVGSSLNDSAKTHLTDCENCQAFEQKELNLTQMINSLPKVEAPKDFGFRLNAYIAKTEEVKRPLPAVWQTLRYALPFAAAVLIFGFVIFNSSLFTSENQNNLALSEINKFELEKVSEKESPQAEDNSQENFKANNDGSDLADNPASPTNKEEKKEIETGIVKSPTNKSVKTNQSKSIDSPVKEAFKPKKQDLSGSKVFASTEPTVLLPRNGSVEQETDAKFIDRRKQLLEIGILAEDKNWRVSEVFKESVAAKSGVQIGDVIVEINKIPVSAKIPQSENIEAKSLKVLRDKNTININLVN